LTVLGHLAVCPVNTVCIGPLALHFCVSAASCRTRRICALCAFPFPGIRSALDSPNSSLVSDPPSPFSFLLETWSPTRLPPRADPLSSPLPYLLPTRAGSAPWLCLSPQHKPFVYLLHALSTSCVLCPLALALLLHPHSPHIRSRATRSSRHPRN